MIENCQTWFLSDSLTGRAYFKEFRLLFFNRLFVSGHKNQTICILTQSVPACSSSIIHRCAILWKTLLSSQEQELWSTKVCLNNDNNYLKYLTLSSLFLRKSVEPFSKIQDTTLWSYTLFCFKARIITLFLVPLRLI